MSSNYHKRWQAKQKLFGKCVRHANEKAAPGHTECQKCLTKRNNEDKIRRTKCFEKGICHRHSDQPIILGKRYCQICSDKTKKRHNKRRDLAIQKIFEAHGINECHRNIHPNMPEDLKKHECWGALWFEHPNGGGRKDIKNFGQVQNLIALGRKDPKEFMILCQLHQLWNQIR